jgi:signal transduction histidine kinase
VFVSLHRFVARDIEVRSDAWLSGEVEVLGDVAERTPKDALYQRAVEEVAELASREVPNRNESKAPDNSTVFFLEVDKAQEIQVWAGPGNGYEVANAIRRSIILRDKPSDVTFAGYLVPYRVAMTVLDNGSVVYLGLSERDQRRVLANLRNQFALVWILIVLLGYGIVFSATRRMLNHVRRISEAASGIGHSDLSERVPVSERKDEVSQLAITLNRMLDRIEESMHQLHTITDSLAHDLRSPLTAIRGKMETSLTAEDKEQLQDAVVASIEELDRLTDFLNTTLDVAEARADALRLSKSRIDLSDFLRSMVDLYEPSLSERGMKIQFNAVGLAFINADAALIHRMLANLFDNELKHLPDSSLITIRLGIKEENIVLQIEDNGPGFSPDVIGHLFEKRIRGKNSQGHGLGLAFVDAVVRAHSGSVTAGNREEGGAYLSVLLPRQL